MTVAHDTTQWHTRNRYDFPGQGIGPSQRPLTCATHKIHNRQTATASGGIRTCNPNKRDAMDLRLRQRGNRVWHLLCIVRTKPKVYHFVYTVPSVHGAVHVNITFSCLLSYLNETCSSTYFLKSILILTSSLPI
jgi:hypothetical protein